MADIAPMSRFKGNTHRKITKSLLRALSSERLEIITRLDLSYLKLQGISGLNYCPNLETILLQGNLIDYVPDLGCCQRIWRVDLSCNQIKVLNGFFQVPALGVLNLSHNKLTWNEILKLKHIQIVNLFLCSNKKLISDPHYRRHVIDCLPFIWFLDGGMITALERELVLSFFENSALSTYPVRHKTSESNYIPTFLQTVAFNGHRGSHQDMLYQTFARNERHDAYLDQRRILFFASHFKDCILMSYLTNTALVPNVNWIFQVEETNILNLLSNYCALLIVLICSQIFEISEEGYQEIYSALHLQFPIVDYLLLFKMTRDERSYLAFLLFAMVKKHLTVISQDFSSQFSKYCSLCKNCLSFIAKVYSSHRRELDMPSIVHQSFACFLIFMLALSPKFATLIDSEIVMGIAKAATLEAEICSQINFLQAELCKHFDEEAYPSEIISKYIIERANRAAHESGIGCLCWFYGCILHQDNSNQLYHASRSCLCQHVNPKPIYDKEVSLEHDHGLLSVERSNSSLTKKHKDQLCIGDEVILEVQKLGKIISVPDNVLALVYLDGKGQQINFPTVQNDEIFILDNFCYLYQDNLLWDKAFGCWKYYNGIIKVNASLTLSGINQHYAKPDNSRLSSRPLPPFNITRDDSEVQSYVKSSSSSQRTVNILMDSVESRKECNNYSRFNSSRLSVYIPFSSKTVSEQPIVPKKVCVKTQTFQEKELPPITRKDDSGYISQSVSPFTTPFNKKNRVHGRCSFHVTYNSFPLCKTSKIRQSNWTSFTNLS